MNRQLSVHSPGSFGLLRTVTIGVPFGVTHLDTAGDTGSADEAAADAEVAAINNAAAARRLGSPIGDCGGLPASLWAHSMPGSRSGLPAATWAWLLASDVNSHQLGVLSSLVPVSCMAASCRHSQGDRPLSITYRYSIRFASRKQLQWLQVGLC